MDNNTRLPACHRYISGDTKPDKLFTLALASGKIEVSPGSAKAFHALLLSEKLIEQGHPLPKQISGVSCFQIASEYKCGYICHMCPYALKNKNQFEMQETMLLSFALKNHRNLQILIKSGLQTEHLKSLLLLNDFPSGKIVPTLPLTRLAFQYLQYKVTDATIFSELPSLITEALDQNNKGKLLPQNVQTIRTYLSRLQLDYKSMSEEKALELSKLLQSPLDAQPATSTCLSGLLGLQPENPKIIPTVPSQTVQKDDNENSFCLPPYFSEKEAEQSGYSFVKLTEENPDYRQLESFLQFNPMIGAEVVTDQICGKEMLLLCASEQFFYFETDNEDILALLAAYFNKSRTRKQICMEPFRLYYFLSKNSIGFENVFSLQGAYKLLSEKRGNHYTVISPAKMVKELLSRENMHRYSPHLFVMPFYVKMYNVLNGHPLLQSKEAKYRLKRQTAVDSLMGISYEYLLPSGERKSLFTMDNSREPIFSYQKGQIIGGGQYCVTFTFSSEKQIGSLIHDILYRIASRHLAETHGYRLLKYTPDSFTVSTPAEEYEHLCDLVANLATYLSERDGLTPLYISEECTK